MKTLIFAILLVVSFVAFSQEKIKRVDENTFSWYKSKDLTLVVMRIVNDSTADYHFYKYQRSTRTTTFNKGRFMRGVK